MDDHQRRLLLERLFAEHAGAVRAYAARRVDAAAADDAVSEVFVIAWRRLDDVPVNARPWLLGCARRVLAHQRRRTGRDAALALRLQSASAGRPTGDEALASAFAQLRERDRELLMLIAWEGLEPQEAAAVLGCTRQTLAVRLHRARKRLAAALNRSQSTGRPDGVRSTREIS